jgi:hypothetical protein
MILLKEKENGILHLPGLKNEDHLIPKELLKNSSKSLILDGILGKFVDESDLNKYFTIFNLKKINHNDTQKFKFVNMKEALRIRKCIRNNKTCNS